ncbi:hypothetical protein D3C85_943400 [compost metagenome]
MNDLIAGGIDDLGLAFHGVEHQGKAAILAEAHWPQAPLVLDHLAHLQGAGVHHGDGAVVTVGHIHGVRQRRIGNRQRVGTRRQVLDHFQPGHVDHAQGAAAAVADKGVTQVLAEGDFVVAFAGGEELEGIERVRIDDGHPALAFVLGVVADPQQALVRLQGDAHRRGAGTEVGQHLEFFGVDHRHLTRLGHGHEDALVIYASRPVHGGLLEGDARQGAGHAPHRHRGVDDTEACVLVQHHQVVTVEIEQRPRADAALEVQGHPGLAALGLITPQLWGLRLVEPGTGGNTRKRLPRRAVGDLEAYIGK